MTKIAVVDNHGQFTHLEGRALKDLDVPHEIVDNTVPPDQVLSDADGVVLSGGPSMEDIGYSPDYLDHDVPVLGICLGHQVIAEHLGGEVESGEYGGFADVEVELLERNGLFEGLGDRLSVWASHADEVTSLPPRFKRTARSEVCGIEAMRHEDRPLYGVQWHPEVHHTERGLDVFRNFVDIVEDH